LDRVVVHTGKARSVGLLLVLFGSATACRESLATIVSSRQPTAASHAEQLFAGLGARFVEPARDAKYDSARMKLASAALLPSRIWKDTAVWTGSTATGRALLIHGQLAQGRYRLHAVPSAPHPTQLGESRHLIELTRLSDSEFAWDTDVNHAIGGITAAETGALFRAMLSSAAGRTEHELRADYGASIPVSAAVLGQLFRVDSVKTSHLPDRSTLATFVVTMTPSGIEQRFPKFARYMRRYAETARMRWTLTDRAGAMFVECSMRDGRMLLRVRTHDGRIIALSGATAAMPDSLQLNGDFAMKVRRFTVGFENYEAEFHIGRGDHERAWTLTSRREPKWVLPFVTERLLRTPLRRPFQDSGATFRLAVVDDPAGGQSVLHRRLHLEVQESAILRFLGRLGAIAVSDYTGDVEREMDAWVREVFDALVTDVKTFEPSP
jgi:hypothetical protein